MDSVAESHYKAYEEYSKTLRTWLVAYGIGAPVLLLNSDQLRVLILKSGQARIIGIMFLAGVGIQVALAAVNKAIMWYCYHDAECRNATTPSAGENASWLDGFMWWLGSQIWIDFLADLSSGILFVWGTAKIFAIVSGAAL